MQCSPNNPLNREILERTTATYFIIYIVNRLFMSNNDLIQLDWLEREFFATGRAKWEGVLIKVDSRSCSPGLIEFSGGCNVKTPSRKNQQDIIKLYSKMINILKKNPSDTADQTFCLRYYSKITIHTSSILCSIIALFFFQQINISTLRN